MATKTVNYTPEMETVLREEYTNGRATAEIAAMVGRSTRSVVAKLSRMGLYKKPERLTKTGEPVTHKNELVNELAKIVELNEAEQDSLTKANKSAIKKILVALS